MIIRSVLRNTGTHPYGPRKVRANAAATVNRRYFSRAKKKIRFFSSRAFFFFFEPIGNALMSS